MALDGEHLLREVGERMHISLRLDPKTRRCVLHDRANGQEYLLELPLKNPYIYLYTVLRNLGEERQNAQFLCALLGLNLFGLQTDGCTVSIDGPGRSIIQHLSFPIEFLTPQLLVNLLTNFIATARKLRGKIENLLVTSDKEIRRRLTHYSPAEAMDKKRPGDAMRIIRI
jgi:hypothetical protein